MDSKLPRKDYFSSTVTRNLLIVSGVETNPGPAGTSENKVSNQWGVPNVIGFFVSYSVI